MKLLLCLKCNDIFNLADSTKECSCKETGGRYLDHVDAVYWGHYAVPLGFDNLSVRKALIQRPNMGKGSRFQAFVIPKNCSTMNRINRRP